ncbi:MAG: YodL domain-containing protein [Dialister invisus]
MEDIYRTFNADDRPAGFRGHSLSVSDVIVINRGGKEDAHYSGLRRGADRQGGRKDTGQSL